MENVGSQLLSLRQAIHVVVFGICLLAKSTVAVGAILPFTEEAVSRGVAYLMQNSPQTNGHLGFGCGFADLDSDGDPDIILMGALDGSVGIFENDGTGNFIDRSDTSGIPTLPQGSAFVAGDYDGDGDLDIYFTQIGLPNVLMSNHGNFFFAEVTQIAGVGGTGSSESASFGDFNGNGRLDLYVVNYFGIGNDIPNKLYRNLGDGTFFELAADHGVDDTGLGFQSVWFDYDRDGDVDLYLSNDKGTGTQSPNQLYRNDNGKLVNVSVESGTDVALDSMGVACGDFDGNGWPDLYCTNVPGAGGMNNPLLLNQGDGVFVRAEDLLDVDNPFVSWGAFFFDFDNDGLQDLYVNNMVDPNTLYRRTANNTPCVEIGVETMVVGNSGISYSSAIADVDGDGDLDILLNNFSNNVELFINHEGENRNWIRFRLVGLGDNKFGVGTTVGVRVGDVWQYQQILAGGNGYKGQNELVAHFGLSDAVVAQEVAIYWPGGFTTTLENVNANQVLTVVEADSTAPAISAWGSLVLLLSVLTAGTVLLRFMDNRTTP